MQHYKPVRFGGITKKRAMTKHKQTVRYDRIKNRYADLHGYPILRIKYEDHIDELGSEFLDEYCWLRKPEYKARQRHLPKHYHDDHICMAISV